VAASLAGLDRLPTRSAVIRGHLGSPQSPSKQPRPAGHHP